MGVFFLIRTIEGSDAFLQRYPTPLIDSPRLYDADGNYRGKLGSNPWGADSPTHPCGKGLSIYGDDDG